MKPKKSKRGANYVPNVESVNDNMSSQRDRIPSDVMGSYTGKSRSNSKPTQDVDDL